MKKCLAMLLLVWGAFAAEAQKREVFLFSYFTHNGQDGLHLAYSEDGRNWKALKDGQSLLQPALGKEKLMRDPCIITGPNGMFHMVWTVGWNEKGIGYAQSKDLIHWSPQRYIPVMEHEPGARNCWAPEITYDKKSRLYYIYWATTIEGKFTETAGQSESQYNHRMYYVTTSDFASFSETNLLYDGGFNVIDVTAVKTKKGYALFLKDETVAPKPEKNIRLIHSPTLLGPFSSPSAPITGNYWAEGPTVLRQKDSWIVYFDKYREHKMGAVRSKDLAHWEDISDQVSFPAGVRHGTVFAVKRGVVNGW